MMILCELSAFYYSCGELIFVDVSSTIVFMKMVEDGM